jgi:flagellar hook-associated protein 1 FlgK
VLDELAGKVGIDTVLQDDGSVNVMIGNGQSLVVGQTAMTLAAIPNPEDPTRLEVAYQLAGTNVVISNNLTKGDLGGVLNFRDQLLVPTRNELGRLAASMALSVNAQHRDGMDLDGALGADFFAVSDPHYSASAGNTGSLSLAYAPNNIGGLTGHEYRLSYDGANYVLYDLTSSSSQTLGASGSGPFSVDGLVITEGAAPNAGDTWSLQPTRYAARDIESVVTDPRKIAAAVPIKTKASLANVSNAAISPATVLNVNDASLLNPVTITFEDPPTTFQINGVGGNAYTSGADIDVNGWRVQISGAVQAGDTFTISSNAGGVGDNANAQMLAALQKSALMEGGTATYGQAYEQLIGKVGTQTRQADLSRKATGALLKDANDARQEVSGVNLDEEAADLLRFQQAYKAAAQVISAADDMFQALLSAVGR